MQLIPIGTGLWGVYAIVDETDACNVIECLIDLEAGNKQEAGLAKRMRRRLEMEIPHRLRGPNYQNNQISRFLRDNIYEFKRDQNRGPGLRVLWFFGRKKEVICTTAFLKTDKTPQNEIDNAVVLREQYFIDLDAGRIEIIV